MKEYILNALKNQDNAVVDRVLSAFNAKSIDELYSFDISVLTRVIGAIIKENDGISVRIDANFADFPFFSPSRGETALTINTGDGYVRMTNVDGLPTSFDADVFMALLYIAKISGFPDIVHFNISHIADILKTRKASITESIERLGSTNYTFYRSYYYNGQRISVKRGGITLFEYELWTPDSGVSRRKAYEKNWFRLNPYIRDNIAKYYVSVNLDIFRRLSPVSKRLHLLLSHRLQRKEWIIDVKKLMEQIPILTYTKSGKYSTALKLLKRSLLQLKEYGIISGAKFYKNGKVVIYV